MSVSVNLGVRTISTKSSELPDERRQEEPESKQQPAWHVAVLGILTADLYIFYWAFKTWRDLKNEAESHLPPAKETAEGATQKADYKNPLTLFQGINPLLRTLALVVFTFQKIPGQMGTVVDPFFSAISWLWYIGATIGLVYILAVLTIGILSLNPNEQSFGKKHPLISCALVVGSFLIFRSCGYLPGAWWMVALLMAVPFAFVQHWLNDYWRAQEKPGTLVRHAFNLWEMAIVIICGLGLGFIVSGMILGVKP